MVFRQLNNCSKDTVLPPGESVYQININTVLVKIFYDLKKWQPCGCHFNPKHNVLIIVILFKGKKNFYKKKMIIT